MMNVMVLGANGQLGAELVRKLAEEGCNVIPCDRSALDLSDSTATEKYLSSHHFEAIVNCAAYTAVDRAEQEPELAYRVNRDAPGQLAKITRDRQARFIHISTDFVFDGEKSEPYIETDSPNPLGVYGDSKLKGEKLVMANNPQALILRTSWVYGNYGSNFVKTMLRLARENEVLRVVDDQFGSPTWTKDITDVLLQLIPSSHGGIYHFSNSGVVTWHQLASAAIEIAKETDNTIIADKILPINTDQYPTPATRPKYSALSGDKLEREAGISFIGWRESLRAMLVRELKA